MYTRLIHTFATVTLKTHHHMRPHPGQTVFGSLPVQVSPIVFRMKNLAVLSLAVHFLCSRQTDGRPSGKPTDEYQLPPVLHQLL